MTDVSAAGALRAAFRTDPGRVRLNNEDVPIVDAERGVYGVIDGVGGQAAGELAAAIAYDVILQRLARPLGTPAERVREAIAIANNEIFRRAAESPELYGMTCVVTLAVVADRLITIGHVGDSRLYKVRGGGLRKLTHDHSPVGEREDAREISELAAMQHPRRHEVFRDVGSAYRDKDEDDYVEVIEEAMERDSAILLCTDGLTDMIASAAIEEIVRRHAGDPDAVVDALVDAANEAGGKDNVTVVYAEGPDFAQAVRSAPSRRSPNGNTAPNGSPEISGLARFGQRVVRSRTTWFLLGALVGVLGALAVAWRIGGINAFSARTLVVGHDRTAAFTEIADAMRVARAGDVVRLEPGVYRERVVLGPGISLVARVPGTATLARAPAASGDWIAVETLGDLSGRISGIRVESTPDLPVDVGLRVSGQSWTSDLLDLSGSMRAGVQLAPGAVFSLQGSHLGVQGPAIVLSERSSLLATGNLFLRSGHTAEPPICLAPSAQVTLKRNTFAGFGADVVKGLAAAERQQILSGNVIISSEPSVVR